MAVSQGYQTFVLDQLRRVLPGVRAKRMFGGVGLYADELFFALIDDDVLYLKVDDETRHDFEQRGLGPFQPFGEGSATMQYYPLPEDLLEDPEALSRRHTASARSTPRAARSPLARAASTVPPLSASVASPATNTRPPTDRASVRGADTPPTPT